jgi:3,4-dihydroxy 2-butanone 4-phosphate synthase/GTP cyclohydrolase II
MHRIAFVRVTSVVCAVPPCHLVCEERQGMGVSISNIEDIIKDAAQGRMVILVDDEDRENEGDLLVPAECVTPEIVNFMAREGRGLICLAMDGVMCDRLKLEPMAKSNTARNKTAFTISIEAKEGISTGISAYDRAHTIKLAINPDTKADDLAHPGHVFPIRAVEGGVLNRNGHTEAAVDIAKLAGFSGAGVICEVMNDDGHMARLPDLLVFAEKHGLKVGTIADLIDYRRNAMAA